MRAASWLVRQWQSPWGIGQRAKLAAKAALAAGIAWQATELFPSSIERYAYYAPLGAVLAMYPTLVSSLRAAVQTVLGILIGATIALVVDLFLPTSSLTIALLIGAGILAGTLTWLGEQRSWVPITALFVFTISDPGSISYAVGYVGLTLIGVTIGTAVNFLLLPPLHLRQSRQTLQSLQDIVSDQLQDIAEGLENNERPDTDDWERRTRQLSPMVSTMHEALSNLSSSARGNPRAWRHRHDTERQERQGEAFQRMALLVEDLVSLLAEVEGHDVPALPFNDKVRLEAAAAMRRLADLTRGWTEGITEAELDRLITAAADAVVRLEDSVVEDPRSGGSDPFVAGSVVTTLRRCLGAMITSAGRSSVEKHRSRLFR